MAYPVFQSQGPQVNVSLFGDAARTGVAVGQATPTFITSAIQGAEKGYQQGQDIRLKNAQIENAETISQINKLKLDEQTQLEGSQLKAQEAILADKTTQATQDNQLRTAQNDFFEKFQSATPEEQKAMVLNGENASLFAQSGPQFSKGVYNQLRFNPTLTSEERQMVDKGLGVAKIDDFYQKSAQQNLPKFLESKAAAFEGVGQSLTSDIVNQLQVPMENAPDSVRFVQSGSRQIDEHSGYVKLNPKTNQDVLVPSDVLKSSGALPNTFDVISTRPDTLGKVVARGVPADTRKAFSDYIAQRSLQTGMQAEYAKRVAFGQQSLEDRNTSGKKTSISTFGGQDVLASSNQGVSDPFKESIKAHIGTTDEAVNAVSAPITTLKRELTSYVTKPELRNKPETLQSIGSTIHTVSRGISDHEFDTSEAIQTQYTQSHVDAYNKSLDNITNLPTFAGMPKSLLNFVNPILDAFKVKSPKDLYYTNRSASLVPKLWDVSMQILSKADAKSVQAANKAAVIKDRNAYLSGVAINGPADS